MMATAVQHQDQRFEIAKSAPIWLGPYSSAPGTARASARAQLAQWGRPELADDAELVISELTTNAVRASEAAGSPVAVRLVLTSASVVVQVLDSAPGVPVRYEPGADAECGRGLQLVAALSSDWGWTQTQAGKIVWAEIAA